MEERLDDDPVDYSVKANNRITHDDTLSPKPHIRALLGCCTISNAHALSRKILDIGGGPGRLKLLSSFASLLWLGLGGGMFGGMLYTLVFWCCDTWPGIEIGGGGPCCVGRESWGFVWGGYIWTRIELGWELNSVSACSIKEERMWQVFQSLMYDKTLIDANVPGDWDKELTTKYLGRVNIATFILPNRNAFRSNGVNEIFSCAKINLFSGICRVDVKLVVWSGKKDVSYTQTGPAERIETVNSGSPITLLDNGAKSNRSDLTVVNVTGQSE